eukprot:scaffold3586_cov404-Prasinococcus_capsulatus_cf.AAC.34
MGSRQGKLARRSFNPQTRALLARPPAGRASTFLQFFGRREDGEGCVASGSHCVWINPCRSRHVLRACAARGATSPAGDAGEGPVRLSTAARAHAATRRRRARTFMHTYICGRCSEV